MQEVAVLETRLEFLDRRDVVVSVAVDDLPERLEGDCSFEMNMELDFRSSFEDVLGSQVTPAARASLTASEIGPSQIGP